MEKLAKQLASEIAQSLSYDKEKEAVVAYGLIAIIQISITIFLVLLFGVLLGAPVEALIICFSASILRKYSGGAHADTPELCTAISVVYCTSTAFISKSLFAANYSSFTMAISVLIIYGLSFLIVYKFAPVDSPNKPIKAQKKKRMRKGSFILLSIYFALSVVFWLLSSRLADFKSYGIGILFGISWQIFTLTYFGHQFIERMNHIQFFRKEEHI